MSFFFCFFNYSLTSKLTAGADICSAVERLYIFIFQFVPI